MYSYLWKRLLSSLKRKMESRAFMLPGFHFLDLLNPYYIDRKTIYDFVSRSSKKYMGNNILDFGCGGKPYKNLFLCENYIGCDIRENGNSDKDKQVDVYYDGHKLPFDSQSFDIILSTQVFEHIEHFNDVFGELERVLKKGGFLIITVPFCYELHEKPFDFRRFTRYGIKKLFKDYDIEILELENGTDYITTIRFLRCIYYDNIYRQNKTLKTFFQRYMSSLVANLQFIIGKKRENVSEDLSINFFVIGRKL